MTHIADDFNDYDTPRRGVGQDIEEPQEKLEKTSVQAHDTFGDEEFAEVKYKVLSWW